MGSKGTYDRFSVKNIQVISAETLDCTDCNSPLELAMRLDAFELESGQRIAGTLLLNRRMFNYVRSIRLRNKLHTEVRFRGIRCEVAYG